jgi:hypothetical protein
MGDRRTTFTLSLNSRLGWGRTVATGFALLFMAIGLWSAYANLTKPTGVDFISFWAAGRLVLEGHPALAYDIHVHRLVEQSIHPHVGLIPFPYPPPFLAIVTPFAVPSFGIGATLWVALTAAFFALAVKRLSPLSYAFGNAPSCVNFMIGQSGFFVCGIFIFGLSLISTAPFAAGCILGLMLLKPQLALLLPVAALTGREWRMIAGAAVTATAVLVLGFILFGADAYLGFWNILPHYVEFVRDSRLPKYELASVFGLARFCDISQPVALAIHVTVALTATVLTARAWWMGIDERVPTLAAATMLISPYFFTYDCLLIVVPLAWLATHKCNPVLFTSIYVCTLIPIITSFSPWIAPNTMPLAAIACLYALHFQTAGRGSSDEKALPLGIAV